MKFRAVFLVLAVLVLWQGLAWVERWGRPPQALVVHPDYEIVLFVTDNCAACDRARAQLIQAGVRYFEYDIEASAEGLAKFDSLNGFGVPLLVVADQVIRGYNQRQVEAALAEYSPSTPP